MAEQELGPASDPPEPPWISAWIAVQHARMSVLYWLNDTDTYARLIEQVRPFVEAHGSAEQRAGFLMRRPGRSRPVTEARCRGGGQVGPALSGHRPLLSRCWTRKSRMREVTSAGLSRQEKWPQSRIVVARTAGMARRLASRSSWFDQSWSP